MVQQEFVTVRCNWGGRVFNATSANGFLYMLEQLPVQSGTRFPMVLNLVTVLFQVRLIFVVTILIYIMH